ncbi:MAG: sugar ABC transporter permease [Sphaerochaetaceae bacterium]
MKKSRTSDLRAGFMFTTPGILIFVLVVIIPFLYGFYLTFTDWNGVKEIKNLIGFKNYANTFKDKEFWASMLLTLRYVAFSVILVNAIAFLLAYLLTSGIKGQNFFRAGFFTPNLIGGVVLGFIWQFIFLRVLPTLGKRWGWTVFTNSWLSDPKTAFWALVVVTVWQLSGYMMLIYIAGFMSMNHDVLEAASIDGAIGARRMWFIIMPLMVPSFVICVFMTLSRSFMVYDINLTLTKGGPYGTTRLVAMHVYEKAFTSRLYGIGQAEALFLFFMVAIISAIQISIGKKREVAA